VILEKHNVLGGECTGWDRRGYHIDGCIHWLVGTKKGTPIHDLWTAVGALDGVDIYHPESFLAYEYDGIRVQLYRDLDRLKSSWLELSPQDEADYYIAACDAHVLYEKLLKGKYPDPEFQKRFNNPEDYPLASEIRIAIGYEGRMDEIPRTLRFPVAPFKINGKSINYLTITHYGYEPDFAPAGHTLITCSINQFHADYDAWDALAENPSAYSLEKTRIGKEVIGGIEKRFPQMSGKLNLLDVATPKTFERYCNAYRGAFMPFLPTIKGKMMAHTGHIKGLENIFLSGQWLQPPGGLPVALITGKDSIMRLCKMKNKLFIF
jgi:phytoene desaturase